MAALHIPPLRKVAATGTMACSLCKGELFKLILDTSDLVGKMPEGGVVGPVDIPSARLIGLECHACGEQYPYERLKIG